jgi:hypothetical protein
MYIPGPAELNSAFDPARNLRGGFVAEGGKIEYGPPVI